ncbi:MAG: ribonuclease HII [Bdellovibrionia bacterium]
MPHSHKPSSSEWSWPTLTYEVNAGYPRCQLMGVDEVGRGCIAGPVVAAAAMLPQDLAWDQNPWLTQVTDSKALSPEKRDQLAPQIAQWLQASAIGVASVEEIDQINIFHASHLAMIRAVKALEPLWIHQSQVHLLVDGKFLPKTGFFGLPTQAVIQGDLKCLSIACASILAKVWRDQHLTEFEQAYPGYGFAQHKGYPTPQHTRALKSLGVTPIHRKSFKTVQAVIELGLTTHLNSSGRSKSTSLGRNGSVGVETTIMRNEEDHA